jgi:hypothetical protein
VAAQVAEHFRDHRRSVGKLRVLGDLMQAARPDHIAVAAVLAVADFAKNQTAVHFDGDDHLRIDRLGREKTQPGAGNIDEFGVDGSRLVSGDNHANRRTERKSRLASVFHTVNRIGGIGGSL